MTSLFPPFNRRNTLRKLPYFYEAGRGAFYKATASAMTLNLNFTTGSLDPRITFSRGTNATLTDSTGKITYAPNNIATQSNTFSSWITFASGGASVPVVTPNYAAGPDGVAGAASRLYMDTGATPNAISQLANPNATGISFPASNILSIWVRSNTGSNQIVSFVASDGTVALITATTSWQRFSQLATSFLPLNSAMRIRATNGSTSNIVDIQVAYAQSEVVTYQTTPSTYNATTTSAYYGPRFNYDPVTLACKGLLIEEQRTNFLTYSNTFNNAVWTSSTMTPTVSAVTSPDGTANAWALTGTSTGSYLFQSQPTTTGTFTASVYLRAGTVTSSTIQFSSAGNGYNCAYNLSTGQAGTPAIVGTGGTLSAVSATMTSIGNSWYRCTFTFTTSGTANNFFIYGGNGTITAYGAQVEAGSFATSYIPTTTATVTRNADVASMTGSNFSSWFNATQGSLVTQFDGPASGTRAIVAADDNSANNNIQLYTSSTDPKFLVTSGGATQADIDAGTVAASTAYKFAGAYATNDFAASISGGAAVTDTSGTVPTVDRLRIGANQAANYLNGHIASIQYYNKRLPNATLQSLTT